MADDSWKTQRIQDHFVVLCNELDVDRISPVLRQEGMLTADEFEQLTNQLFTTQNRRQKLLLFIPRKGRTHFEKFCECLVWSGQTELARKIGVPVEKIPPSPHPYVQPSSMAQQQDQFARLMMHIYSGANIVTVPPPPYPMANMMAATTPPIQRTCNVPSPAYQSIQETSSSGNSSLAQPSPPVRPPQPPVTDPLQSFQPDPEVRGSTRNVFILYCNDEQMGGEFCTAVKELADFLVRACGAETHIRCDLYLDPPSDNWPRWTEQQIKECDQVLLVCSKTLKQKLHAKTNVHMKRGIFSPDTVYNLIQSPKFIPVFVNHTHQVEFPDLFSEPYQSWVPTQLLGTNQYWLDLDALHRDVRETETEQEYRDELACVLGQVPLQRNLEPIANLLRVLQGAPEMLRPTPFSRPIFPLTEPTTSLPELSFTDRELLTIAGRIPRDWQTLGIKLGLLYTTLDNIHRSHVGDVQGAVLEMLNEWRRVKQEQATRTALREALEGISYVQLAEEVFGKN